MSGRGDRSSHRCELQSQGFLREALVLKLPFRLNTLICPLRSQGSWREARVFTLPFPLHTQKPLREPIRQAIRCLERQAGRASWAICRGEKRLNRQRWR